MGDEGMNTANFLTSSRIILLPIFLIFFFSNIKYNLIIAGIIFGISALTDLFDGYVARKYNQVTRLGRLLDPLADKLTLITVFISLAVKKYIPYYLVIIILVREFIILVGSVFVYFNNDDIIRPNKFGKTATFLLYVAAFSYIFRLPIINIVIYIAIPLTLISGVSYFIRGYNHFFKC